MANEYDRPPALAPVLQKRRDICLTIGVIALSPKVCVVKAALHVNNDQRRIRRQEPHEVNPNALAKDNSRRQKWLDQRGLSESRTPQQPLRKQ